MSKYSVFVQPFSVNIRGEISRIGPPDVGGLESKDPWPCTGVFEFASNAKKAGRKFLRNIQTQVESFKEASGAVVIVKYAGSMEIVEEEYVYYGTLICTNCGDLDNLSLKTRSVELSSKNIEVLFDRKRGKLTIASIKDVTDVECTSCGHQGRTEEFMTGVDNVLYEPLGIRYTSTRTGPVHEG